MKGNDDFKSFEINQYGEVPLFYIDRPSESSSALLYDYFAEFQDKKAKVIEKLINKNIKKAYELCSYSEEEKELFSGAILSYRQECEELMSILKRAYRTMSILEAEEKKSAGYNEDKIASVKAKYKEYKEILADNTRSALSKVSQEHKGIVLKAAACSQIGQNKKITIDYNDTNSYGYICEDLFLDMIVRNFAEETMCGYPIKNKEIELENGEEITFVNGIAKIEGTEEIISIPYIYTGTLKALNKNGKVYVVKNISDTIKFREANITKAIVGVRNTFDNKTFKDIKKIFSENNNEKVVSFNMAQRYGKGIIKNSVSLVAQLKSPTGEIVNGAETPIATYRTEKCLVSKLFMNKTGTIKDIQVHEDTSACFMIVSNLEEDLQRGRNASNLLRQNILDVTSTYTKVTNKKKEEVKINAEESDEI
jgi:hypothetical protein